MVYTSSPSEQGMVHAVTSLVVYSEILISIGLSRNSWGLYLKCVIALIGAGILIKMMFCEMAAVTILGHVVLPLCAYIKQ